MGSTIPWTVVLAYIRKLTKQGPDSPRKLLSGFCFKFLPEFCLNFPD